MKADSLEQEIFREHSKRQVVKIGNWIGRNERRFGQLMKCYLRGDRVLSQRSAWIMGYCGERNPYLLNRWIPSILKKVRQPGNHIAVKRNALRVLQFIETPRWLLGETVSLCFDELENANTPVAVRVYAMNILLTLLDDEPDLANEIIAVTRQLLPHAGPGLRVAIRRALKKLDKAVKT